MNLSSINTAYGLCDSLYGVTPNESDFEDLAMEAWGRIGTKHTRLYRYIADVHNHTLKLPCNAVEIESVHIPVPDAQLTSSKIDNNWTETIWIEDYIDYWKRGEDLYWHRGKLVKYDEGNGELYFRHNYKKVMVIYHGIIADEETGLPLVNDKEIRAIATYVAYATLYKEGLRKRDVNTLKIAADLELKANKLFNAARVPEHLSQNDMNAILDVKVNWDRKMYGKSYKPIR